MKQAFLDRIRVLNKYFTNKLLIHIAGRRFGHFAILTHTGRKTGKTYRIPIIAEPFQGGFVIAMTYGKKVDWYPNLVAKGGGTLRWKNRDYQLVNPHYIDKQVALSAFPKLIQSGLRIAGLQYFVKLDHQP
jgi:deazaflavin-dependent oxidoreductase (nitroreductase family)